MSDITLNPLTVQLAVPGEEAQNQEMPMLQLVVPTGIPLQTPQGIMPIPADIYRIPIPKELAIDLGQHLVEEGEKLPDPKPQSNIEIAGSLNDDALRRAQEAERSFRAGGPAS